MRERPILFTGEMVREILAGRKTQTRRPVKSLRVRLRHEVASDPPMAAGVAPPLRAPAGAYPAKMNLHGAVAIELRGDRPPGVRAFLGVKPQEFDFLCPYADGHTYMRRHPYGRMAWHLQVPEGQRLWVRETFNLDGMTPPGAPHPVTYRADWNDADAIPTKWKPGIHMPRWASRLLLEVTEVRVERLQAITEEDAKAEGMPIDVEPCDHTRQSCADVGCLGQTRRSSFCGRWEDMHGIGSWTKNPWVWVISFRRVEAGKERADAA
jgi:hypothetical protein